MKWYHAIFREVTLFPSFACHKDPQGFLGGVYVINGYQRRAGLYNAWSRQRVTSCQERPFVNENRVEFQTALEQVEKALDAVAA